VFDPRLSQVIFAVVIIFVVLGFFTLQSYKVFPKFIEFGISCNVKKSRTTKMMTTAKITWPNLEIKQCCSKLELLKTNHSNSSRRCRPFDESGPRATQITTLRRYFKE
jgi:hypothetical protein